MVLPSPIWRRWNKVLKTKSARRGERLNLQPKYPVIDLLRERVTGVGLNLNQPFVLEIDRTGVDTELKQLFLRRPRPRIHGKF